MLGLDVAPGVGFDLEVFDEGLFGSEEAHGEEDQLRGARLLRAGLLLGDELALVVLLPLDLDGHEFLHVARLVADEFLHRRQVDAGIGAELRGGLLLAVVHLVGLGPLGPGIVGLALQRRPRENFDLHDALAALTD